MRRSHSSFSLAVLVGLVGATGCLPAQPVTPVNNVPAPVEEKSAAPTYDLSPVAEPADLIALAKWKNPAATAAVLATCSGAPASLSGAVLLDLMKKALADLPDHDRIAAAVATDAPIDLVVALNHESRRPLPIFALSLGLRSVDEAKKIASSNGQLDEVRPGVFRVGSKGEHDHHLACVAAVAAGAAPARLVCGFTEKSVLELTPYVTRTLSTAAPGAADVHAEVRVSAIDAQFGKDIRQQLKFLQPLGQSQLSIDEPEFDEALGQALSALADEAGAFVGDVDKLTMDLNADAKACLTVSTALDFRRKDSWIAQTTFDHPERQAPPPGTFWRLPKDSDSASFRHLGDPARVAGILKVLRALAHGELVHEKVGSEADRKALVDLLSIDLPRDADVVSAAGHVAGTAFKPLPDGGRDEMLRALLGSADGWSLMGIDEPPATLGKTMKDVAAALNRKSIATALHKLRVGGTSIDELVPVIKVTPAPAPLGAGAVGLTLTFEGARDRADAGAPKGGKKPDATTIHVLLMADGKTSWIASGGNRDELVKRLLSVKTNTSEVASLNLRAGLAQLKDDKLAAGGFFSLSLFSRKAASLAKLLTEGKSDDLEKTLSNLPHKGETPNLVTTRVTAGPTSRVELMVAMPKDAMEDIGAIVGSALRTANHDKQ